MTEPFSPTISLPPDFSDVIERLEEREENERTPLLTAGSVISVVTDPGNFGGGRTIEEEYFPSTSRSIDGRRQIQNERGGGGRRRRRRLRTVRRVHSESDIRNPRVTRLRRPFIASPFMPAVATQTAVADRRLRAATTIPSAASTNIETTQPVRSSGGYGALSIKRQRPNSERPHESADDDDDDDDEEDEESESSSEESSVMRFSDLTGKDWMAVGMLAVANLCSTIAFSCIAPFYPAEAQMKGLTVGEVGIIFGAFELVMFFFSPILGKYMHVIGAKRMFSFGIFFTGITAIAFGFLNLLPPGRTFFWASLGIRCAEALGDAAFVTSSFVISAKCFPGRIATIVGIMETFAGLGYTAGPVIGGVLYEYGGFQLPFFVLGALLVLATIVSFFLIEEFDEEDEDQSDGKGMIGMLKIPVIWIMVFAVIICAISLSFFDPTLADHLSSFKLSTTLVGLMFLLCGGIYTATAPLWGILIDKWHCTNALMVFGSTATIFSMLLIGPSPIFNFEKNLILIGLSLAILGVAAGALYIPTFQNCLDAVKEYGYDDSFQTYGCVSGVFQSAFACGAFIGPTLGAYGVQKIGFGWTTTIIAFINVIFVLVLTICWIAKSKIFKGPASKDHEPVPQA